MRRPLNSTFSLVFANRVGILSLCVSLMAVAGSDAAVAQCHQQRVGRDEAVGYPQMLAASDRIQNPIPTYRTVGSGPLLVYVAGLDGTGELLFKQIPGLSQAYRVVTFRSRDHGLFTYDDLADDVASIINDVGGRSATIVAESFGGAVALTFALRYRAMVDRLVIVNSFARFHARAKIKIAVLLSSMLPFWITFPARAVANTIGLRADGVKREDRAHFFKIIRTVKREGYVRRLKIIKDLNLENRLSEIKAPTLFIAGDRDLLIPSVKEANAMARQMPNATVKVVRGAGHACLLSSRVRLAELLVE
jgi:pimeloyl-ACP methyl ester carboxylesterase